MSGTSKKKKEKKEKKKEKNIKQKNSENLKKEIESPRQMKAILGTMEMGRRACDQKLAHAMVDAFVGAGFTELDTALMYCDGETEKILGKLSKQQKAQVGLSTKANPWNGKGLGTDSVLTQAAKSLESLDMEEVDIFYLHAPDHNTPVAQSLLAIHQLHSKGKFKRFGLSNYSSWEVAEIYYLCQKNNYILPTVYQGMYNAITRGVELELFPCLRHFNISFYAYNPLAGGLLTGRYKYEDLENEPTGRFFGNGWAEAYRSRYWKKKNFEAIEKVTEALTSIYGKGAVSMSEASLRWLAHHSKLSSSKGDGVILGASSMDHLKANLRSIVAAPLHKTVVDAIDNAWVSCMDSCPNYFR